MPMSVTRISLSLSLADEVAAVGGELRRVRCLRLPQAPGLAHQTGVPLFEPSTLLALAL